MTVPAYYRLRAITVDAHGRAAFTHIDIPLGPTAGSANTNQAEPRQMVAGPASHNLNALRARRDVWPSRQSSHRSTL